jgi:uncharacterized protein (DUF2141 family)
MGAVMDCIRKNSIIALCLLFVLMAGKLNASELVVSVEGNLEKGVLGCALFDRAEGFPTGPWLYQQQFPVESARYAECRFKNLVPGRYAVAIMHDLNGNLILDKNFLGVPKEPWGVSNNVRPNFRAPEFEESSFEINEIGLQQITIRIAK